MWSPDLYDETLHFAASAHEGQFVPGKNYSYVVHKIYAHKKYLHS
jgi:hypothetical protein